MNPVLQQGAAMKTMKEESDEDNVQITTVQYGSVQLAFYILRANLEFQSIMQEELPFNIKLPGRGRQRQDRGQRLWYTNIVQNGRRDTAVQPTLAHAKH